MIVKFFLQSENFPFLGVNGMATLKDTRCRTTFYMALGRLLMVDLGEDEDRFDVFMRPLTSKYYNTGDIIVVSLHANLFI